MNAVQTAYAIAKTQHEAQIAVCNEFFAQYEYLLDSDDEADFALYEEKTENAPHVLDTLNVLIAAEDALIEWALNKVNKIAFVGEEKDAIEIVRQNINKRSVREQVIAAAMKLS